MLFRSSNALVVGSLKVGGLLSNAELTKTILDNLILLQNGSDFSSGTNSHTHDGRYYTKSQLYSDGSSSGSDLVGDDNTYSSFIPVTSTLKGALEGIDVALNAVAANSEFQDSDFRIKDNADATKKIAFEASSISSATVRIISMPDANVDLADANNAILKNGSREFTAAQSMGGFRLTNLADPTSSQDAVTLAYLNARSMGLSPKKSARVATTGNINLSSVPASIDGVVLASGDRIAVWQQSVSADNGIYVFNGAATAATRANDFDSLSPNDEVNGAWIPVQEGNTYAGRLFIQYGTVSNLGTDAVNFETFDPIAGLSGGDMITFTGSVISLDLATISGLESTNPGNSGGQLRVKLEASNPSLKIDASNQLGLKISATGALAAGSGGVAVQVDGSTIEISSNALRLKDIGITAAKLSTGIVDQKTITGAAGTALAVQSAPRGLKTVVAGESMAANTSFLVRYAVSGETAGRVYKADKNAATTDKFYAWGIALSSSTVSAGGSVDVTFEGTHVLGSADVPFNASDIGKAVYLTSSGNFSVTAPTATDEAVWRIGMVENTDRVWVGDKQLNGIN